VSGHGGWIKISGPRTYSKVTVWLQTYHSGSGWITRATGSKKVKPGTGSSRRAHARFTCRGNASNKWRSAVDVDIIGVADTPEKAITPTQKLACGV
jgi:hypothetical protein